mgnify:CR=1 FL=1
MSLSIIIPALNEAANLPELLAELAPLQARGAQIIVAYPMVSGRWSGRDRNAVLSRSGAGWFLRVLLAQEL